MPAMRHAKSKREGHRPMSPVPSAHGIIVAHIGGLVPTIRPPMHPVTLTCANPRADGSRCGETALVHVVHYVYRPAGEQGWMGGEHELSETQYEIDCPRCGHRTQIE